MKIVKFSLFFFNVIFWLAGLAAVGTGLWMYFDPGRFNKFLGQFTFTIPVAILIGAGLFVSFVGFCGCWGAVRESKCMLGTYFTMLWVIFCSEMAAGVLGLLYLDKIRAVVTDESRDVIKNKFGTGDTDIDFAVNTVQEELKCCGAYGRFDYNESAWSKTIKNNEKWVPESCCDVQSRCISRTINPYKRGCIEELINYLKDKMVLIAAVAVGLSGVQLLGMIFACVLFFAIDDF